MRAVFGHPFSILWFSPFSTPDHGKAETYQYVVWELARGTRRPGGSEPKWDAQHSPPFPTLSSAMAVCCSQCRKFYFASPTLAMDSFFHLLFFVLCCRLSALDIYFMCCLQWVELQRKRNTLGLWSCLQTLWSICVSFWPISSICLCIRNLFSCSVFTVAFLKGLRADELQKNPTYSHLFSHLFAVVSGHAGSSISTPEPSASTQYSKYPL